MSLAKSLRKAGYLQNATNALQNFIEYGRRKDQQSRFNKLMDEAATSIKSSYASDPEAQAEFMELPPISANTKLGMDITQGMQKSDTDATPGVKAEDVPDITEDLVLGDATGAKYGTITPQQQQQDIMQVLANVMMKSQGMRSLPESVKSSGIDALKMLGSAYQTPTNKPELKQFDPEKDLYEIDNFGNIRLRKPGVPKAKAEKSIGSYTGADGKHYISLYDPETKTVRDVPSEKKVRPPASQTVKIEYPEPEKWKDFGAYLNSIEYKEDPETGAVLKTTPEEKNIRRQIANNAALSNLLPGAYDWYQKEIVQKWDAQNISQADFEREIEESIKNGEITPEEAQDLLDYNAFRPAMFDVMRTTARPSSKPTEGE